MELTASEKEPEGAVSDNMVSDDSAVESESVSVDKIAVSEDAADAAEALDDTASGNDAPADESASDNAANAAVSDNKSPTTIINNINNQVDISPQSYTALYKALHEIAADAETAVVEKLIGLLSGIALLFHKVGNDLFGQFVRKVGVDRTFGLFGFLLVAG